MPDLVFYLLVFFGVGVFFLFFHLMLGKLVRPSIKEKEKLTIYECGEPTVGSAWVQFDLRYYVVALLFVIFDVEVAFFFPWAVVFGNTNKLISETDPAVRAAISESISLPPSYSLQQPPPAPTPMDADTAFGWSLVAFVDIMIFFGVLLVGFAYLWRRGDINWVRSTAAESLPAAAAAELPTRPA